MVILDKERREYARYFEVYDFSSFIRDKTILITGATGMISTALIKWILLSNDIQKTNTHLIASTRHPESKPHYIEPTDYIEFCSYGNEKQILENINVDYIIHTAAPTNKNYYLNFPIEAMEVLVDATKNMLEIAKSHKSRLLYLSSIEVYGEANEGAPITEDYIGSLDSKRIRSCYPIGKLVSEFLCKAYFEEYGVPVSIIRLSAVQGFSQPYEEPRVFNEILRCIIEKKDLILNTDGQSIKCFMYTLDAISAILTVLLKGSAGEFYNATNPVTYMTIKDLANYIFNNLCPANAVKCLRKKTTEVYLNNYSFVQDISKIKALGWSPITDIIEMYKYDIGRFENG